MDLLFIILVFNLSTTEKLGSALKFADLFSENVTFNYRSVHCLYWKFS